MPSFTCKHDIGDMVDFKINGQLLTGTVQYVTFFPDVGPKYGLEEFKDGKWNEHYWDILETHLENSTKELGDNNG